MKVVKEIKNKIELANIPDEAFRNYHYLWYTYNNNRNFTIFCTGSYCDSEDSALEFMLAEKEWHFDIVEGIQNSSIEGLVLESNSTYPPCEDQDAKMKFKIETICNFLSNISSTENKEAFLKLMKYTKQSPVYLKPGVYIVYLSIILALYFFYTFLF